MKGPPLGPGGEDITWPDQVAPWGRKASNTRKVKPQTSNHQLPHGLFPISFERPPVFTRGLFVYGTKGEQFAMQLVQLPTISDQS